MQAIDPAFLPVSALDVPRFAGVPTFMRLPHVPLDKVAGSGVEIGNRRHSVGRRHDEQGRCAAWTAGAA